MHISPFRNEDTCAWAIQETTRFFTDALIHYPTHKLEFIAIEDRVTVIIRAPVKRPEMGAETRAGGKQDAKGKAKAVNYDSSSDSGWSTSSTSFSESSYESAANAKMEALLRNDVPIKLKTRNVTIESVHGVKIFEKEVRAGEL